MTRRNRIGEQIDDGHEHQLHGARKGGGRVDLRGLQRKGIGALGSEKGGQSLLKSRGFNELREKSKTQKNDRGPSKVEKGWAVGRL